MDSVDAIKNVFHRACFGVKINRVLNVKTETLQPYKLRENQGQCALIYYNMSLCRAFSKELMYMSKPQKHRKEVLGTKEALLLWEMRVTFTQWGQNSSEVSLLTFLYTLMRFLFLVYI